MTKDEAKRIQTRIGAVADGNFGSLSRSSLFAALVNTKAKPLSPADIVVAAQSLDVDPRAIRAVRKVEAPRGAYDSAGRPTILYEKHVFGKQTGYRFNRTNPVLSSNAWQPGTYGPFSKQYGKLEAAAALDVRAAFEACSWGAFQVLGANAVALGYPSAIDMALDLAESEAQHLVSFVRFVKSRHLDDELRACQPDHPDSCVPFVAGYNGPGFALNRYDVHFAAAMAA